MRLFLIVFLFCSIQIQAQKNTIEQIHRQLDQYDWKAAEVALEKQKMFPAEKTFLQARVQQTKGKYASAEQYFEQTNQLANQKENSTLILQNLTYQVFNNIELRQLNRADSLLNQAKQLALSSTLLLYHEALLRQTQDRYQAADSLFHQVKNESEDSILVIRAHYHLGELKFEQEQFSPADSILKLVSSKIDEVLDPNHLENAFVWNHLGRLYTAKGRYKIAKNYYEGAICSFKDKLGDKHIFYGKTLYNLGVLLIEIGDYQTAEEHLLEAEKIYKKSFSSNPAYAVVLGGLEDLYQKLGQTDKELRYAIQQRNIYLNTSQLVNYARVSNNLSYTYQTLDSLALAENILRQAIQKLETTNLTKNKIYAILQMNFAGLNIDLGNYETSKTAFEIAKKRIAELYGVHHPWYAAVINNLASLYEETKQYKAAKKLYLETEEIDRSTLGEKHPYYVGTLYNLANIHQLTDEVTLAHQYFQQANTEQINLIYNYYSGFDEATRLDYLRQTQTDFDHFFSFVVRHNNEFPSLIKEVQDISLAIKNLALDFSVDQQSLASSIEDEKLAKTYKQWRKTKELLAQNYITTIEEQTNNDIDLKALENEAELLEKALLRSEALTSSQLGKRERWTTQDIQQKLAPKEAVIDFLRFHYYEAGRKTDSIYYAAILHRSNFDAPKMILLTQEQKLKRILRPNVRAGGGNYVENLRITEDLYNLIWRPISIHLEGVEQVHLSAIGLLHKLAFVALSNGKTTLLQQHNFTYYSNLRSYLNNTEKVDIATLLSS